MQVKENLIEGYFWIREKPQEIPFLKFSKQKAKRNVARPRLDIVLAFLTPLCSSARSKLKAISLGGEGGWVDKQRD